jgi:hypothetical protein
MAVETLDAASYARIPYTYGYSGTVKAAWGLYDMGVVVVEDGDIRRLCKLPQCLLLGGHLWAGDLDTGTETIDIDIGWAANGGGSETYTMAEGITFTNSGSSASATGLVNSGVLTGDAITDLVAAGANYRPFPMAGGPLYFSRETTIQAEVNAPSATPATAKIYVLLFYIEL